MVSITSSDILAVIDTEPDRVWLKSEIVTHIGWKIPDADAVLYYERYQNHNPTTQRRDTDIPSKIRKGRTSHIIKKISAMQRAGQLEQVGDERGAAGAVRRPQIAAVEGSGVTVPQIRNFVEMQIVPVTLTTVCQHFLAIVQRDWVVQRHINKQRGAKPPPNVGTDEYFWEAYLAYISNVVPHYRHSDDWTVTRPNAGDTVLTSPAQRHRLVQQLQGDDKENE